MYFTGQTHLINASFFLLLVGVASMAFWTTTAGKGYRHQRILLILGTSSLFAGLATMVLSMTLFSQ